ncbi:protein of unknown function [Variovorax sp. YR634]|jgi:hypothetical protein|uniref:DUF4124 domain-containing protein n=1 Tax=unclassified Variovorax TaxID=663243 RepID=UPI000897E904|nr:DUF4124 domain-containing protein [Variovorax sp. YR634]SDY29567.1 protein of unknown function [Variovorax sp. YR634]
MVRQAGAKLAVGLTMMGLASGAMAQHAIYKCVQGGKVVYSNEPCPDAKKIEIKQTKGVNYEGRGSGGAPKR